MSSAMDPYSDIPGKPQTGSHSTDTDSRDRKEFLREEKKEQAQQRVQETDMLEEIKEQDDEIMKKLVKLLGISEDKMKRLKTSNRGYALSTMAYLLVIVGCELDLYGFSMAFPTYWHMDHIIIKLLLIVCPLGYLVATALYLSRDSKGSQSTQDPHSIVTQEPRGEGMVDLGKREPIKLEFYHFIPLVRYYMVVKEKTTSDVEGIFRINSLSSFSLGVAQICSMVFLLCVDMQEPDIFVMINIGSQVINWTITGLYFGTSLVSMMKMTVRVDALIYNSKQDLVDTHKQYLEVLIAASRNFGAGGKKAKDKQGDIERGIKNEIRHLSSQKEVDLDAYPTNTLLNCLGKLREIEYHSFRQYGKD